MDWQFGDVFLLLLVFFAGVLWFSLLFAALADLFRRHDLGAGAKTGWVALVLVLPFVGALTYLVSQGGGMSARHGGEMREAQAQVDAYIRSGDSGGGAAREIGLAKNLLDAGSINQAEFDAMKAKALGGSLPGTPPAPAGEGDSAPA